MGNGKIFINRELSWLEFDARVLGEAKDASNPLFERLKFLSITASNLDEFFMVRVASLKDMVNAGYTKKDIAGMSAKEQLEALDIRTHDFVKKQYEIYNDELVPSLAGEGFHIIGSHEELTQEQISFVDKYFHEDVYPVLTPMAVDSSRPFPLIRNKTLNIAALLKKKDSDDEETEFATVQVPSVLPRFVKLPGEQDTIILLEEIIERNIDKLFLNYDILCAYPYRIMRNADFSIDEEDAADRLKEIEKQLRKRQWGQAIRLEVQGDINKKLLKRLKSELNITDSDIYRIDGPLDLRLNPEAGESAAERLMQLDEDEIIGMLVENSDEPYARQIAAQIMKERKRKHPIDTTTALRQVIEKALEFLQEAESKEMVKKSCQRTFQALRIDVNSEFEVLDAFLGKLPGILAPGGRVAILTFHSGEDRMVKKYFKQMEKDGIYSETAKDVIRPSAEECVRNSRARSTKMRWAVKA